MAYGKQTDAAFSRTGLSILLGFDILGTASTICFMRSTLDNIQLLPFIEGDMTICSPEAGNISQGQQLFFFFFVIPNPF